GDKGHLCERLGGPLPFPEAPCIHRKPRRRMLSVWVSLIDQNQPAWIAVRQRLEQYAADDCKQGDVGSDAQRHHQNSNERESGRAAQGPKSDAKVVNELLQSVPVPRCSCLIAQEWRIAQFAQSGEASFFWTHPGCEIEFNLPVHVIAELFV